MLFCSTWALYTVVHSHAQSFKHFLCGFYPTFTLQWTHQVQWLQCIRTFKDSLCIMIRVDGTRRGRGYAGFTRICPEPDKSLLMLQSQLWWRPEHDAGYWKWLLWRLQDFAVISVHQDRQSQSAIGLWLEYNQLSRVITTCLQSPSFFSLRTT